MARPARPLARAPARWLGAGALLLCAGCATPGPAGPVDPADPAANLFANPGFERGPEPWSSLESQYWGRPFSVSAVRARGGAHSALLELRSDGPADPARICGVVVEVAPEALPERLSGHYYVDRWEAGTALQYLQVVVIAWGARNIPLQWVTNHQVRYLLAGVERQPTQIRNARYAVVSPDPPALGRWVRFDLDLRDDFAALWGSVPEGFEKLRILFEVRWDGRQPGDGPSHADVYYDDLYLGPAPAAERAPRPGP